MLSYFVYFSFLVGLVLCRPSNHDSAAGNYSVIPLSPEDREWLMYHVPTGRATYPPGFKYMYVSRVGRIVENSRPSTGDYIEVVGSPQTPNRAMYAAALSLGKMFRYSRPAIFNKIARKTGTGLGLFTAEESVTVFPDAAYLKGPPECQGRCDGSCSSTCTFDGRKFADIPGITIGVRSFVLVDNVLCTSSDPYGHKDNIVVHEFAHSVQRAGMNQPLKHQLMVAYNHAKRQGLWAAGSYAMSNSAEYFAEGTGSFFLVNLFYSSGGMTNCHSNQKCQTEQEVRQFLHDHDLQLWTLLTDIFTQGDATLTSGLTICPGD